MTDHRVHYAVDARAWQLGYKERLIASDKMRRYLYETSPHSCSSARPTSEKTRFWIECYIWFCEPTRSYYAAYCQDG